MPVATPAAELGMPCPAFSLPDVFGVTHDRDTVADGKALLVVFFCNHCPYAKAVEGRLISLHTTLASRGLRTVLICANDAADYPDDSVPALRARAVEMAYPFPYLVDESQAVAHAFDAACTPDCFVFDGNGSLAYRGRIDDNWKRPEAVTRHELHDAIVAVLEGQAPAQPQHPSLGCSIKWRT